MGDNGNKETNKMLKQQTALQNTYGDKRGGIADTERLYSDAQRGKISDAYWDLYGEAGGGEGGGGGGGPAYNPLNWANARENEAMSGYRNLRDTGGWSDPQMQDFRSRASSTMPSFFEGLKNQLSAQNAGLSGNVGYGSQMNKLARDASRGAADQQLNAEVELQGDIRNRKQTGLEGVGNYDTEFMGNQQRVEGLRNQEIQNAQQAAMQAASNRSRGADDAFRNRMGVLGELRGLRGEGGTDLAYNDRQLAGYGGASRDVSNRVQETTLLDQIQQGANIAGSLAGSFAGAATGVGALGGGVGGAAKAFIPKKGNSIVGLGGGGGG